MSGASDFRALIAAFGGPVPASAGLGELWGALIAAVQNSISVPIVSNLWYSAGFVGTSVGTDSLLYATLVRTTATHTYKAIGTNTTVAGTAGAVTRMGVYDNVPGTLYPGNLLLDAGTVPTNVVGVCSLPMTLTLPGGLCWTVIVPQGAPTTHATYGGSTGPYNLGNAPSPLGTSTPSAGNPAGYAAPGISGPLPTPFPSGIAVTAVPPPYFPIVRIQG